MGTKAADNEGQMLDVSEYLFRLTTECLRLYSNETNAYQDLASLISARLLDPAVAGRHEVDTIGEHFRAIPTRGKVRICLKLSNEDVQTLDTIRQSLGRRIDATLTIGDALSALLFDYYVEQKVARIMGRLEREELFSASIAASAKTRRQ